jgi:hypothetical protein
MLTLDRLNGRLDQTPRKHGRSNKSLIEHGKRLAKAPLLRSDLRTRHRINAISRRHNRVRRTAGPAIPRVPRMKAAHMLTPTFRRSPVMMSREAVAIPDRHIHMRHGGRVGHAGDLQRGPGILVVRGEPRGMVVRVIKVGLLGGRRGRRWPGHKSGLAGLDGSQIQL